MKREPNAAAIIDAAELISLAFAPDGDALSLRFKNTRGGVTTLRMPTSALQRAFARLARDTHLTLEATTGSDVAKVEYPGGYWTVDPNGFPTEPTLTCRSSDGIGFDLRLCHDAVTAVRRVQLSLDL